MTHTFAQLLSSLNSKKYHTLRPSQEYILQQYARNYVSTADVAVELPTGAGKTLIALLIAEDWRKQGKKVAILSANKTLARQMHVEADALGIPSVLMEGRGTDIPAPDKRAYQRATKVAIMNYWVYINQNPVIDAADLVIMDDAHLAEHCLHSLYSVEISAYSHESLFDTLVTELQARFPEYSILSDAITGDISLTTSTELLSFIDQVEVTERIREIIDTSPYMDTDTDLRFRWRRIRDALREANIYLGLRSIWIRPYVYPLLSNSHYHQTEQRIYMSATIGDPGDLSRRLGVKPITKVPVPKEFAETTSGRRLVVMNQIEDSDLPERLQRVILSCLRIHPKSVWLCSSEAEARKLQELVSEWLNSKGLVGHPTWLLTPLGDEIDQFKSAPKGHLFVAGRFDGMDFNAEQCRLVVLTTLPRAINTQEEFISAHLRDSGFMLRRLNQRIVQALGRCNRSDDDFGIYVLADKRFATHFGRESNREGLPSNIIAEIDMAQDSAEIEVATLVSKVGKFLHQDFTEYDQEIKAYIDAVPEKTAPNELVDTSNDEVIGWSSLFPSQNFEIAADRFERCCEIARQADLREISGFYGWQWAKALYLGSLFGEPGAREKALNVFEDAIRRGGQSSWFNRMRASLNRARNTQDRNDLVFQDDYASSLIGVFDDILEVQGTSGHKFERWCLSIESSLQSDSHAQYQEGLERLGKLLGYYATRPKYNSATDCRWRGVFGNTREVFTFEAKIEHDTSQEVAAKDIGQAHNQHSRAVSEYESRGFTIRSIVVTHLTTLTADAEASAGSIRIIPKSAVFALWERVKLVLSLYRDHWSLHDFPTRQTAAQMIRVKLPNTGWFVRAIDGDTRFVTEERLLAEWAQI